DVRLLGGLLGHFTGRGWSRNHFLSETPCQAWCLIPYVVSREHPPSSRHAESRDILGKLSSSEPDTRASGGIGRRAGFRCQCPYGRGGSSPPSRTDGPELRHGSRTGRGSGLFVCAASDPAALLGHQNCLLPRLHGQLPEHGGDVI